MVKRLNEGIFDPNDEENYYSDKAFEFDQDWEDTVGKTNRERDEKLGKSADDVFNGKYGLDSGDYFDQSDYRFIHDASGIREPNNKFGEIGNGIYGVNGHQETFESKNTINRKGIKKLVEDTLREAFKNGMFNKKLTEAGIPLSEFDDGEDDAEMTGFEEYEKGYPSSDFDPSHIDKHELISWCKSFGDFLYIYNMPFRGWRISSANSTEIQAEIIGDIAKCISVEPSHDMDWLMMQRENEFDYFYVSVIKLSFQNKNEDYYIVYEVDK